MQKTVRNIAIILLLVLLAYGFSMVGTPTHNRQMKMDITTLNRANNVHAGLLAYYYRHNKTLPATLNAEELNKHASENPEPCRYDNYSMNETLNAEALSRYEYSAANNRYTLCADFNNDWSEIKENVRLAPYEAKRYDWVKDFSAGHICFERTLTNCKRRN
jgi:hypothetical protein